MTDKTTVHMLTQLGQGAVLDRLFYRSELFLCPFYYFTTES